MIRVVDLVMVRVVNSTISVSQIKINNPKTLTFFKDKQP